MGVQLEMASLEEAKVHGSHVPWRDELLKPKSDVPFGTHLPMRRNYNVDTYNGSLEFEPSSVLHKP